MAEKRKSMAEITISVYDVMVFSCLLQVLHGLEGMIQENIEIKVVRNDFTEQEVATDAEGEVSSAMVVTCDKKMPDETACLKGQKSLRLLEALRDHGLLDGDFHPVESLSWAKRGYLAYRLATELNIVKVWKVFGHFWGMSPDSLRSGYNRFKDQQSFSRFEEMIKPLLR